MKAVGSEAAQNDRPKTQATLGEGLERTKSPAAVTTSLDHTTQHSSGGNSFAGVGATAEAVMWVWAVDGRGRKLRKSEVGIKGHVFSRDSAEWQKVAAKDQHSSLEYYRNLGQNDQDSLSSSLLVEIAAMLVKGCGDG